MRLTRLRATATAGMLAIALVATGCGSDEVVNATSPSAASTAASTTSSASAPASSTSSESSASKTGSSSTSSKSSESSTSSSSSSSSDDSDVTSATTTVGDSSGELDETSTIWFDTFCTGLKPLFDVGTSAGAGGTDPEALKKLGEGFTAAGEALTQTSSDLAALEPPTFDGGADFAEKTIPGLSDLGTSFSEVGPKLAAGDYSALETLGTSMQSGPLQELSGIEATPELKASINDIPSCSELGMS